MYTNRVCHVLEGEFAFRVQKNFSRLQEEEYMPETIFARSDSGYSWPGDWEGRILLALSLHKKTTGAEPLYLKTILDGVLHRMELNGFLGISHHEDGLTDEQQLAGHSWLLRGLLECTDVIKDNRIEKAVHRLVQTLYLPTKGRYIRYPVGNSREMNGKAIGTLQTKPVNEWILSTDIGCCFIALDGLTEYESRYHNEELMKLLLEMADIFMQIDHISVSMQIHASLSATRGILRLYQLTGTEKYYLFAKQFLTLYIQNGMTENYANFNWFLRPEWTEPCAIVDSFQLAVELYKLSGDANYIELANRIFYNGLETSQRINGGFGCDTCNGPNGQISISTLPEIYEAYWCCSMRGAEGLCYAINQSFIAGKRNGIFLNYFPGQFSFGEFQFKVVTEFPYDGKITITFETCPENCALNLWIPEYADKNTTTVLLNGKETIIQYTSLGLNIENIMPGYIIELHIALKTIIAPTIHFKYRKKNCWYGILQLGCDGNISFELDELAKLMRNKTSWKHSFYPINQRFFWNKEEILEKTTRIIF